MAGDLSLSKAQLKWVHLRRGRPAASLRPLTVDPPAVLPDELDHVAWREFGADKIMDHWLEHGLGHALANLADRLTTRDQLAALARRLRERLAVGEQSEYDEAVPIINGWARNSGTARMFLGGYLLPDELGDVLSLADAANDIDRRYALFSCSNASELDQVESRFNGFDRGTILTLADTFGTDLLRYLYDWLPSYIGSAPIEKELVGLAMQLKSERAWRGVLSRVHEHYEVAACRRDAFKRGFQTSPELAARVFLPRLVAGDVFAAKHRYLGENLIFDHPELIDQESAGYDEATKALVREVRVEAPPGGTDGEDSLRGTTLPPLLASPPWENRKRLSKRITVAGVEPLSSEPYTRWLHGERDRWLGVRGWRGREMPTVAEWDTLRPADQVRVLRWGDYDEVRHFAPRLEYPLNQYHRDLLARFELDLTRPLVEMVHRKKESWETPVWELVPPFGVPEVVAPIVELYGRRTKAQRHATAWLYRHPELAATHLIPRVVSPERKGRSLAEAALRVVARHDEVVVRNVADRYGDEVAGAVGQFLDVDPLDVLPSRMPKLPDYLRPSLLKAPVLTNSGEPLPPVAVEHVVLMVAMSKESEYAGIAAVREFCDSDSLAAFALDVYRAWNDAGPVRKDAWLALAIDLFGNDSIIDTITGPISKSVRVSVDERKAQLDMLERLGSDGALTAVFHLSEVIKHKPTARNAHKLVKDLAEDRGLTPDQLADRLIRSFDLDRDGSTQLDFGSRSFSVQFDETLAPVIRTADGKVRKSLPKASASDDADLAALAHGRFKRLKRDVKDTAKTQLKRFEQAMVLGRQWPRGEVERYFVHHPLMQHVVRRLVWGIAGSDGNLIASYRITEDGSLADSSDRLFELADDATLTIAHPAELPDLATWAEVFADYEIGQPFEQLARAVYTATTIPETISAGSAFAIVGNPTVPYQRVLGLTSRGWESEQVGSSTGIYVRKYRSTEVQLGLNPGFALGQKFEDQQISPINVGVYANAVDSSEIVRDLVWLSRP